MTDDEMIEVMARAIAGDPACVMMSACPPCAVCEAPGGCTYDARAALNALREAGMVVVPRYPTAEMTAAAAVSLAQSFRPQNLDLQEQCGAVWDAMIAAMENPDDQ